MNQLIVKCGGRSALKLSRCWENTEIKIVKNAEHLTFNIKCIKNEIFPESIKVKVYDNVPLAYKYAKSYKLNIKARIIETKKKLSNLKNKSEKLRNQLKSILSENLMSELEILIKKKCNYIKYNTRNSQKNKFNKLLNARNLEIYNYPNYYKQFSLNDNKNYKIHNNFNEKQNLINEWVINLSNYNLNDEELLVLSLDPKFQISPKTISHEKFLSSIEAKISQTDIPKAETEYCQYSVLQKILSIT